jgi:hypothetical protein
VTDADRRELVATMAQVIAEVDNLMRPTMSDLRDRIAKTLYRCTYGKDITGEQWDQTHEAWRLGYLERADAVIAALTETEGTVSDWTLFRHGEATVSVGQPFYGQRRIVGNAPLSANNFDALIEALTEAKRAYQEGGL